TSPNWWRSSSAGPGRKEERRCLFGHLRKMSEETDCPKGQVSDRLAEQGADGRAGAGEAEGAGDEAGGAVDGVAVHAAVEVVLALGADAAEALAAVVVEP